MEHDYNYVLHYFNLWKQGYIALSQAAEYLDMSEQETQELFEKLGGKQQELRG